MADNRFRETPEDEDAPRPRRRARREEEEDDDDDLPRRRPAGDGGASTIIPYKNVPALIGYYVGVFSLIPCLGLALAPVAVILGIIGLVVARKPGAKGTAHAVVAIILGLLSVGYQVGG